MRSLPEHRRAEIETEIELHLARADFLIARLDGVDAPFEDLEDDDPSGTALDCGEAEGDGMGLLPTMPLYGVDQRGHPVNHVEAKDAHRFAGMGMIRGDDGKWRWPVVDGGRG